MGRGADQDSGSRGAAPELLLGLSAAPAALAGAGGAQLPWRRGGGERVCVAQGQTTTKEHAEVSGAGTSASVQNRHNSCAGRISVTSIRIRIRIRIRAPSPPPFWTPPAASSNPPPSSPEMKNGTKEREMYVYLSQEKQQRTPEKRRVGPVTAVAGTSEEIRGRILGANPPHQPLRLARPLIHLPLKQADTRGELRTDVGGQV